MSLAIWFAMLPLTAYFFYQVPLLSVLLNIVVLPLCGPLLGCSILGGLAGCLPAAFFSQELSGVLLTCSHLILTVFDFQMDALRSAAGSGHITGQPDLVSVLLFYLFLYGGALIFTYCKEIRQYLRYFRYYTLPFFVECLLSAAEKVFFRICQWQEEHSMRMTLAVLLVPCLLCGLILAGNERHAFSVSMLDVGQGDGICISSSDGTHLFVDGGSTSMDHVGTYRILPFLRYRCIRKIDLWLVSHTDEDHVNGILEVLESGYPVGSIVFSEHTPEDDNKRKLIRAAEAHGTEIRTAKAGDVIGCTDFSMKCLYPESSDVSENTNDLSQIWLLKAKGLSMLFTGDLGSTQEKKLVSRGVLEDVDVLKVGHHGSKNSSCEEFLNIIRPENALISVGKHNLYGHPSPEALDRLSACGAQEYATMDYGQLEVVLKGKSYEIRAPMKESGETRIK